MCVATTGRRRRAASATAARTWASLPGSPSAAPRDRSGAETRAEPRREGFGARVVAGQEGASDRAAVGGRQGDQALAAFAEPRPFDRRVAARGVAQPAARKQLAQVQVAGAVLHQEHEPARRLLGRLGRHQDLGAEDRLDAGAARGAVELDRAEEIADVGDGQRTLAVGSGGGDRVVDPERSVDDRKLGVRAQMNESHRPILGSAAMHFRAADHVTSAPAARGLPRPLFTTRRPVSGTLPSRPEEAPARVEESP